MVPALCAGGRRVSVNERLRRLRGTDERRKGHLPPGRKKEDGGGVYLRRCRAGEYSRGKGSANAGDLSPEKQRDPEKSVVKAESPILRMFGFFGKNVAKTVKHRKKAGFLP